MADLGAKALNEPAPDDEDDARRAAAADAEIDAGKGVPHAKVREWLAALAKGEKVDTPTV